MARKTEKGVYDRLGVRGVINACGTLTRLSGSLMDPEVTAAMAEAARQFVDLDELLARSGDYVANLLGVEAAYVTSGAAAGLVLGTAACVAGDDMARIKRLPDTRGMPHRVAVHRSHRNGYDQAVRQVGVELVEFGWIKETFPWQLEEAIDDQTVAVVYFCEFAERGSLPLETVIDIAHSHSLPVIVDAAAELPPAHNLHALTDMGADLVVFSGGKEICGPQSSGLIVGRRDLIDKCALNASPNYSVGRPMKVGKEEIVGLVVALEQYVGRDHAAQDAQWSAQVAYIMDTLGKLPGVKTWRAFPTGPGVRPVTIPRAYVAWDAETVGRTVEEVVQALYDGEPAIAVGSDQEAVTLNPQTLSPGEEQIVAARLCEVLEEKR